MAAVHPREGERARSSTAAGSALAFVAFLAVYREGAETALFYQALFNEGANVALPISLGILAGFAALAVIFTLFYRFGVRIPLRPFFSVTSVLLYYMAFVFMGKGVRELQEGNVDPDHVHPRLPDDRGARLLPDVADGARAAGAARAVRVRGGEDVLAEAVGRAADGAARGGAGRRSRRRRGIAHRAGRAIGRASFVARARPVRGSAPRLGTRRVACGLRAPDDLIGGRSGLYDTGTTISRKEPILAEKPKMLLFAPRESGLIREIPFLFIQS